MTREGGYKALFPYVHNKNRPDWKSQGGSRQRKPHRESFFIGLSENTVALKTTKTGLTNQAKKHIILLSTPTKKSNHSFYNIVTWFFFKVKGFVRKIFRKTEQKQIRTISKLEDWRAVIISDCEV